MKYYYYAQQKTNCLIPTTLSTMPVFYDRRSILKALLLLNSLFLLVSFAYSNPPEEPIKCSKHNHDCTITNSFGAFPDRSICKAAEVVYPTTEEELIRVVANATKKRQKMKVATRYSHSIPKLVCPDGEGALIISTKHLNKVVKMDKKGQKITVESGMLLQELMHEAAEAGLALPHSPYWWGVTIGGLLSTGAHGSSWRGQGGAVHEYVAEIRIISPGRPDEGYVQARTLTMRHEDLNAAKVALGVLGVISQVTLQVQPLFKRAITYVTKEDKDLAAQVISFGERHEFADITWYPSQRKVDYRIDDRASSNVSGQGVYDYTLFRALPSLLLATLRTTEEIEESTGNANGKCIISKLQTSLLEATAYGLTNNGLIFTGYPVVGYQHHIQAYGTCLNGLNDALITVCPWDPRVKSQFYFNTAVSIPKSKAKNFIEDVQKLVDLEPKSLCGVELYLGVLIRYIRASSAYLGKQEDSLEFDIAYYRSRDPLVPRLYEDILEELEQMAVFKYGGLPHWGKNRNVAFQGVIKKYKKAGEFLRIKKRYDPFGLFSNEWTDQLLGLKEGVTIHKKGCALEGLCICSEDIHCAPDKGYYCQPGRIYKEARVCRLLPSKQVIKSTMDHMNG